MSYEKVQSFSFMKDFKGIKMVYASNNIRPLTYSKWEQLKDSRDDLKVMTKQEYVKYWIKGFLDGSLQFDNRNNIIQFTIDTVLKNYGFTNNQETWDDYYMYKSWSYDLKDFTDQNEKQEYNQKREKVEEVYNAIAHAIINKTYNGLYNNLKKEKYYLKYLDNCYITSLSNKSFRYEGSQRNAKVFTAIQKETLMNNFAITKYNCKFEAIQS